MSGFRQVARPLVGLQLCRRRPDVISLRRLESGVAGPPPPPPPPPAVPPSSGAPPPPSPSSASAPTQESPQPPLPTEADLDPNTVLPRFEAQLIKAGIMPIGSRRRRIALRTCGTNIPFEQLPYQAFQEALKILAADRVEKLDRIRVQLAKIERLEKKDAADFRGGQTTKDRRLADMREEVERLKILADINDPLVKKRFEDGLGDMNKPIYRFLLRKKWLAYDHKLITQRIEQFHIVPDLLPKFEPSVDVKLFFQGVKTPPGSIVPSTVSERPPLLRIQLFEKGERLFTVVVVDADVPDLERDSFAKRCHYLAANITLGPCNGSLPLAKVKADNLAVPWLPPVSQKGAPYHRLAIFLLEQQSGEMIDVAKMRELYSARDGFSVKSLRDKFPLRPVGFNIFRSLWDDDTVDVMARHGIPGADVELRRVHVPSVKPPRKPRGWEAKRQSPRYRHLWKYTRRIKGLSNGRGWSKRR
ncbi:hypothetical protein L249_7773 [Ophiocordyceps polyrhachis-furcata BCC 54312]|uniref:Large ribosomal subunit protein mL38 n=1 Tax=Ophiocordyceps polyrhachis-furcata BCC 54312 TaxID=1330021 RepID=A0A367LA56_9HYPO|nr:hypothetical protein L249_7773 [Ophiocordyceps polyrhachis-furcata BCC 54312]